MLQNGPICEESGCAKKRFSSSSRLRLHTIKAHKKRNTESDERLFSSKRRCPSGRAEQKHYCPTPDCVYGTHQTERYFKQKKLLTQHLQKVHSDKNLVCRLCGLLKFSLERDRKYHEQYICSKGEIPDVCCEDTETMSPKFTPNSLKTAATRKTLKLTVPPVILAPIIVCQVVSQDSKVPNLKEIEGPSLRRLAPKSTKVDGFAQTDISVIKERQEVIASCSQSNQAVSSFSISMPPTELPEVSFPFDPMAAGVSFYPSAGQEDTFCQTTQPLVVDASVCTDLSAYLRTDRYTNTPGHEWSNTPFDIDPTIFTTIETQTDRNFDNLDFEELLRTIETQTYNGGYLADIETQTSLVDFEGSGISHTTETQT